MKKLRLHRETVRQIDETQMAAVNGASGPGTCSPRQCAVAWTETCPTYCEGWCIPTLENTCRLC